MRTRLEDRAGGKGRRLGMMNKGGGKRWRTALETRTGGQDWRTGLEDRGGGQGGLTRVEDRTGGHSRRTGRVYNAKIGLGISFRGQDWRTRWRTQLEDKEGEHV